MKKLLALLLCLCMALSVFGVCGFAAEETAESEEEAAVTEEEAAEEPAEEEAAEEPAEEEAAEEPAEEEAAEEDAATDEPIVTIGMGGTGFDTYDADTVVGTVNGDEITWMEYYYWLEYYTQYALQYATMYGVLPASWDGSELVELFGGEMGMTNAQFLTDVAQNNIIQEHAIKSELTEQGFTLSEEDEQQIQAMYEEYADSYSGDGDGAATEEELAAFDEDLAAQHIDKDFFVGMNDVYFQLTSAFEAEYGVQAVDYPDEDALAFAAENGYDLAAKHILLLTVDPSTGEALTDEEIAEKKALADEVLSQLKEVEDSAEELEALFDELTAQYTEDTGYQSYPDGYVFTEGQMVTEFEDAVKELEEYGLSDVVESSYGYHIILRIPVFADATPVDLEYPLRYEAAATEFDAKIATWVSEAEVEWNEGFEAPDMEAIFG